MVNWFWFGWEKECQRATTCSLRMVVSLARNAAMSWVRSLSTISRSAPLPVSTAPTKCPTPTVSAPGSAHRALNGNRRRGHLLLNNRFELFEVFRVVDRQPGAVGDHT